MYPIPSSRHSLRLLPPCAPAAFLPTTSAASLPTALAAFLPTAPAASLPTAPPAFLHIAPTTSLPACSVFLPLPASPSTLHPSAACLPSPAALPSPTTTGHRRCGYCLDHLLPPPAMTPHRWVAGSHPLSAGSRRPWSCANAAAPFLSPAATPYPRAPLRNPAFYPSSSTAGIPLLLPVVCACWSLLLFVAAPM
ncbi:classical arabinogalactan protein 7-like [Triticum urartu]|uniref:classical arabinogalactan protein 7-like n=1 Tax=Triticum urartu TaxID=4572 RepID=UPI002042DB7C|nr:classical arabinogalactan protein 7-like [Triticum urartu]